MLSEQEIDAIYDAITVGDGTRESHYRACRALLDAGYAAAINDARQQLQWSDSMLEAASRLEELEP